MKRAFTFVELLVITAIIVILASVLLPIFNTSREATRQQCLHNLRRIGTAVQLYALNSDGVIVPWLECTRTSPGCGGAPSDNAFRQWTARLLPYIKGQDGDQDSNNPPVAITDADLYPAQGPLRCPDWTLDNIAKGSDAADCDGDGTAGSGLQSCCLPIDTASGRQELFATYGMAFNMCSPIESAAGRPECTDNGGGSPSIGDYGRDGSTVDLAAFAYPGSELYPLPRGLDRRYVEVARLGQTVVAGDGGIWRYSGFWINFVGCEARYIHGDGGNFLMLDGHSAPIAGNAERIRNIGDDGRWIETYFTFYE